MTISFVQELAFGRQVIGIETDSVSGQSRRVIRLGGLINNSLPNKLSNAQAFDLWSLAAVTVTANSTAAPDNTNTADLVIPTAVSTVHEVDQSYTKSLAAEVHTFSVFAKPGGYNFVTLRIDDGGANFARLGFDLLNGVSSTPLVGGTATLQTSFIIPAGNGWYYVGITMLTSAINTTVRALTYVSSTSTINMVGDGVSGVYLWQGQAVAGPISGPLNYVL